MSRFRDAVDAVTADEDPKSPRTGLARWGLGGVVRTAVRRLGYGGRRAGHERARSPAGDGAGRPRRVRHHSPSRAATAQRRPWI